MTVVFVSNYFNHHQKPFSQEMYKRLGEGFRFISTSVMREERRKLGYSDSDLPDYVLLSYLSEFSKNKAIELINNADVVIAGSAPEEMLAERIRAGKLVFRYSERPFKTEPSFIKRIYFRYKLHSTNRKGNVYLLSAGAFAAKDYQKIGMYRGKAYKWGYFPETKEYDAAELLGKKKNNRILWCGRFIDWKHPDSAIRLAKRLYDEGYSFELELVGTGEMEARLKQLAEEQGLAQYVKFLGALSPDKVRERMEEAGIYLLTSDRKEGWGAVLNEAMNSGCAVVASRAAGATSFLVDDGKNGYAYGSEDELFEKVKLLLDSPERLKNLGASAYSAVTGLWNAEIAAERFLLLAENVINGEKNPDLFREGPCSKV